MDRVIKGLAYEGKVSVIATDTTELIESIRERQDLTPTTTAVIGRTATIAGMMGLTEIKEKEDSITIQINGGGPVGSVVCVVQREENKAFIKIYAQNSHVELPLNEKGKIAVGQAVGTNGYLNIIRENEYTKKSYNGIVPLVSRRNCRGFYRIFRKISTKTNGFGFGCIG